MRALKIKNRIVARYLKPHAAPVRYELYRKLPGIGKCRKIAKLDLLNLVAGCTGERIFGVKLGMAGFVMVIMIVTVVVIVMIVVMFAIAMQLSLCGHRFALGIFIDAQHIAGRPKRHDCRINQAAVFIGFRRVLKADNICAGGTQFHGNLVALDSNVQGADAVFVGVKVAMLLGHYDT